MGHHQRVRGRGRASLETESSRLHGKHHQAASAICGARSSARGGLQGVPGRCRSSTSPPAPSSSVWAAWGPIRATTATAKNTSAGSRCCVGTTAWKGTGTAWARGPTSSPRSETPTSWAERRAGHFSRPDPDSMALKRHKGLGALQERYHYRMGTDTPFLWTRRSQRKPNVFSQPIRNLEAGKLYQVRFWVSDFTELMAGALRRTRTGP